ncbi:MAG: hypothetical protein KDB61_03430 [Planctomycetes bacterium]|nr:hypothetical protein [Planctomycetota bacterium]
MLGGIAGQLMTRFTSGQLNLESLKQPGAVVDLLGELDLDALADPIGIDRAKLSAGLTRIVPDLVQSAGSILGGGAGLSSMLGNLDLS